jgi:hypothetical protein
VSGCGAEVPVSASHLKKIGRRWQSESAAFGRSEVLVNLGCPPKNRVLPAMHCLGSFAVELYHPSLTSCSLEVAACPTDETGASSVAEA